LASSPKRPGRWKPIPRCIEAALKSSNRLLGPKLGKGSALEVFKGSYFAFPHAFGLQKAFVSYARTEAMAQPFRIALPLLISLAGPAAAQSTTTAPDTAATSAPTSTPRINGIHFDELRRGVAHISIECSPGLDRSFLRASSMTLPDDPLARDPRNAGVGFSTSTDCYRLIGARPGYKDRGISDPTPCRRRFCDDPSAHGGVAGEPQSRPAPPRPYHTASAVTRDNCYGVGGPVRLDSPPCVFW
jgi:hypothetical protein